MFNKRGLILLVGCVGASVVINASAETTTTTFKSETSVKVKTVPSTLVKKAKWANANSPVPNLMPLVSRYSQELKLTKNQISAFKGLSETEKTQTKNLLTQLGQDNAKLRNILLKQEFSATYKKHLEHYKVNVLLDMASILNMDIKQSAFIRGNLSKIQWNKLVGYYHTSTGGSK
jgi:hypothetical protein